MTKKNRLKYPGDINTDPICDGRTWTRKNRRESVQCPCCLQTAAERKRYLHHSMCRALMLIHFYFANNPKQRWLHVEDYLKKQPIPAAVRGDFAKLVHWGMLVKKRAKKKDGNPNSGYYRITGYGIRFVEDDEPAKEYGWFYNARCIKLGGQHVYISEILGKKKFNYDKLMSNEGYDDNDK